MRCESCGVTVDPVHAACPLCRRNLHGKDAALLAGNRWYPAYTVREEERASTLLSKWLAFIVVAVISVSVIINALGNRDVWWSLYLMPCVLYAWLFIRHTLMSRSHLGGKVIVQLLGLSGMLLWINVVADTNYWSTGYVIPFLMMAATFFITLICSTKKMRWREFAGYLLTLILLGFIPLLLYAVGMSHVLWTAVAAALYALLTFGGMCLLADKGFRQDIKRRLHF
ncbi:hypothetical protein M2277_001373 [Paenibacillus sp. LBL]|uniref:DUF6320 domain-containing protein n=1 Tax=Paenibacillus TaxID=44249 RepID=UPI00128B9AD7|nr:MULTISPECIES: DUF6320 domain-containing protein [Paenibacillus]MDH6670723.1 hypothetical protein [Paenibacillus sp. LBL]MPY17779.1 hypothetical protein [Paenibacillus glucanolyticus]